jgi:hypothetical protein
MLSHQPSIELIGLRIDAPITTLTDVLVGLVCLYAFLKLRKMPERSRFKSLLMYYFLLMCFATTIGGIVGHGFLYLLSFSWKLPGWLFSMVAVALIERAVIEYVRPVINPKLGVFFVWVNSIELLTFVLLAFVNLNFVFVEIHAVYGLLLVVGSFSVFIYRRTKSRGSLLFIWAVITCTVACLVFVLHIAPSVWFNHMDLSHIFLAITAVLFYLGSRRLVREPMA